MCFNLLSYGNLFILIEATWFHMFHPVMSEDFLMHVCTCEKKPGYVYTWPEKSVFPGISLAGEKSGNSNPLP